MSKIPDRDRAQSSRQFSFVNVTGAASRNDKETQRIVRSHVMNNLYQNRNAVSAPITGKASSFRGKFKLDRSEWGLAPQPTTGPKHLNVNERSTRPVYEDEVLAENISRRYTVDGPDGTVPCRNSIDILSDDEEGRVVSDIWRKITESAHRPLLIMPGGHEIDPFHVLPTVVDAKIRGLIDIYRYAMLPLWCPVNPANTWFSFAIAEPSLFHATLFLTSGYEAFAKTLHNRPIDHPAILEQKYKTIKLVNERLNAVPLDLSDGLIAAVNLLADHEATFGSLEQSILHTNGLARMIRMRGGISNLGMNGLLRRSIEWTDQCQAMRLASKPQYQQFRSKEIYAPPAVFPAMTIRSFSILNSESAIPESPVNMEQVLDIVGEIFRGVPELCTALNATSPRELTRATSTRMALSEQLAYMERRLLFELSSGEATNTINEQYFSIKEACRLGAFLFVQSILRGFTCAPWLDGLIKELQTALSPQNEYHSIWQSVPDLLLWVLYVGATTSYERHERTWFVQEMAQSVEKMGLRTWEDVNQSLRRICKLERTEELRDLELWGEICLIGENMSQ